MKKLFNCTKCGCSYEANWTKGLCFTCRTKDKKKAYRQKNWSASDPHGHRVNKIYTHEDGDWLGVRLNLFNKHGGHSIRNREAIEAYNNLKRKYYTGQF